MNCHFCNHPLLEVYPHIWELGDKIRTKFKCIRNADILSACLPSFYDLILPDREIVFYNTYVNAETMITSWDGSSSLTRLYINNVLVLKIQRFYPINPELELKPQIEEIFQSLKRMVVFT